MAQSRAAIRYAKALLSLGSESNQAELVHADMVHIVDTLQANSQLNQVLQSPVVRASDKNDVLKKVFRSIQKPTLTLIDILFRNKRIGLLYDVATAYSQLYQSLKDTQTAKVITAAPLSDTLKSKILKKVKDLTGKVTHIEAKVDKSLIGGFILRIGDLQYDASVALQLNTLKKEFTLN